MEWMIFISFIFIFFCKIVLSVFSGLLNKIKWGFVIIVLVNVICCCCLLESLCGYCFFIFCRWICFIVFFIFFCKWFVCFVVFKLNVIFLKIVMCGYKVKFWNIILIFCLWGDVFIFFVVEYMYWFLKYIFFLFGFLSFVIILSKVVFLYFEGFKSVVNFFCFIIICNGFNVCVFLNVFFNLLILIFIVLFFFFYF